METIMCFKLQKQRVYYDFTLEDIKTMLNEEKDIIVHIKKTDGEEYFKKRKFNDNDADDINNYRKYFIVELQIKPVWFIINSTYLFMFETIEKRDDLFEIIRKY